MLLKITKGRTVSRRSGFPNPIGQMPYEIKEKVAFRNRDNLIGDLDKETKTLGRSQIESLRDVLTKIFRPGGRVNFKCL